MDGIQSNTLNNRMEEIPLPDNYDFLSNNINRAITNINNSTLLDCDEACQRDQNLRNKHQTYLDARENKQNAPDVYRRAREAYLRQRDGDRAYEQKINQNAIAASNGFVEEMNTMFSNYKNSIEGELENLRNSALANKHIKELILKYRSENRELDKNIRRVENSNQIDNRNTYYKNDRILFYYNIYIIIWYIYWFLLLTYLVLLILTRKYKIRIHQYYMGGLLLFTLFPFQRYITVPLTNT